MSLDRRVRRRWLVAVPAVLGVLALGWLIWFTASGDDAADSAEGAPGGMPADLAGLERTDVATGDAALQRVAQMHNKSNIAIVDATVARFGATEGGAEIWVGRTLNAEMADKLVMDMAEAIAEGRSPFSSATWIADESVWQTSGMGQVHYFLARGDGVWWLSINPEQAATALAEVKALAEASSRPSS